MFKSLWLSASLFALAAFAGAAHADTPPPPAYAGLPADVTSSITYDTYGEANFYPTGGDDALVEKGQHWHVDFGLNGVAEDMEQKDAWAQIAPGLSAAGWQVVHQADNNPYSATLHRQQGGVDSWIWVEVFGSQDIRLDLVQVGPQPLVFALQKPAPEPEDVAPDGDYPYLTPLPGATEVGNSTDPGSISVLMPGADEPEIVADSPTSKDYELPGLSPLQFVEVYHDAMVKAGWTIFDQSPDLGSSDATITAHYGAGHRNIWTYMHVTPGAFTIKVGEQPIANLASDLDTTCHVALYGVLFDFNKASLRPESAPILQTVLDMLNNDTSLKIEVQGHTDNVGTAAYNLKLSQSRAAAVSAWLGQHGIAATRLTAVGYGLTRPVADNADEDGRAKNRRVEIAKPGCTAG